MTENGKTARWKARACSYLPAATDTKVVSACVNQLLARPVVVGYKRASASTGPIGLRMGSHARALISSMCLASMHHLARMNECVCEYVCVGVCVRARVLPRLNESIRL